MQPASVNFMALVSRLTSTCLSLTVSVTTTQSGCPSCRMSPTPLRRRKRTVLSAERSTLLTSVSSLCTSRVFDSILAVSSTSPISFSSRSLLTLMVSTKRACFSGSFVLGRRREKPTMALSGVRISWLMLARKAILRRSDSSAFSRDCARISIFRRWNTITTMPTIVSAATAIMADMMAM